MAKRYRPAISYRLREIPLKSVKVWKDAQARKLDRKGITELARSIKTEGLQNPPMVQKEGKEYLLMSGQRRFAALKRLKAKKIPALVLSTNTKYELDDAKAASVVENLHRKDMETREMALACEFLADKKGKSKAAQSLGISKIMFKKYHGFAGVPEVLKSMVPKIITRDEATKIYQYAPNLKKSIQIAERVSKIEGASLRKRYIKILGTTKRMSHNKALKRAKELTLQKKIRFELTKRRAKGLKIQAEHKDMEPAELATEIVTTWLRKRGY